MRKKMLLAVATIISLVLAELGTRIAETLLVPVKVDTLQNYVLMRGAFWTLVPRVSLIQPERYGDILYTVNDLGYRGPAVTHPSNSQTILFLGDSITFALGVDYAQSFASRLEQTLSNLSTPSRYRSLNLALFGYSPRDELWAFYEVGMASRPCLIVHQLYMNDFSSTNEVVESNQFLTKCCLRIGFAKERIITSSAFFRRCRQGVQLVLYKAFHRVRRLYLRNTLNDAEPQRVAHLFTLLPDDQITGFDDLVRIQERARAERIPYIVVLMPNEVQLYTENFDLINRRVRLFCNERNVPFYDPLDAMRSSDAKHDLFLDGLHLSATGHDFVANWLLDTIKSHLP